MKGKRVKRVTLIYPIAKTYFSSKGLEFLTINSQRNIQHAIIQNGEENIKITEPYLFHILRLEVSSPPG